MAKLNRQETIKAITAIEYAIYTLKGTKEAKQYIKVLLDNGYSFEVACHTDCVRVKVVATALKPLVDWQA